jgi:hypothetical protein
VNISWTRTGRAAHVWGGIDAESELGRRLQYIGEQCWETALIYVYDQDDRKPALYGLV